MSRKANPTIIGGFIVGAAALAIVGIAFLGGGKLLAKTYTYVAFFDGSLQGLTVGAPISFKGIRIGRVSNIVVRYDRVAHSVITPVYLDFEEGRTETVGERQGTPYEAMQVLIEQGLRAQLSVQSFVTGQVGVELDFYPDTPAKYSEADPRFPEFPTMPSAMERLGETLKEFDFEALLNDVGSAIRGIDELTNSADLRQAITSLSATIKDFQKLVQDANAKVGSLATRFDETAVAARDALNQAKESIASAEEGLNETLEDIRQLVKNIDGKVEPLATSMEQTATAARGAFDQATTTFATADEVIAPGSELHDKLAEVLEELSSAANSIRVLADYLERHPEALLQGKRSAGGQ